jgi:hypothetical protein
MGAFIIFFLEKTIFIGPSTIFWNIEHFLMETFLWTNVEQVLGKR